MLDFWILSFLAPVCLALANLIDNHVLGTRLNDPVSYDILTTWPTLVVVAAIPLLTKVSFAFDAWFVGTSVGFAFSFLIILYNYAMMKKQGTDVVSIVYTSPMFVAGIAYAFLGERLSPVNYLGMLFLVTSALLVMYKRVSSRDLALGIILVYAFCSAAARVATKYALGSVDIWSYFFWFLVGGMVGSVVLAAMWRKNLSGVIVRLDSSVVMLLGGTVLFSTVGLVCLYSAFSIGSVTLASGLSSIQPSILLVYSTVLLRIRPNAIPARGSDGRWAGTRRILAVLLILAGIAALTGIQ